LAGHILTTMAAVSPLRPFCDSLPRQLVMSVSTVFAGDQRECLDKNDVVESKLVLTRGEYSKRREIPVPLVNPAWPWSFAIPEDTDFFSFPSDNGRNVLSERQMEGTLKRLNPD
jgi:hypothetical protein